ncbi:MAG: hypothetical protein ABI408_07240 [Gemmatimonadaceae bacterium]
MTDSTRVTMLVIAGVVVAGALWIANSSSPPTRSAASTTSPVESAAPAVQPPSPVDPAAGRVDDRTDPVKAEFVYLFDVSTSTHPGTPDDPFARAARTLFPTIVALKQDENLLPQRHRVGTIGAASLMQEPICDIRLEPETIFARRDTTIPGARVKACADSLSVHPPERATDIRGALHFAALTLHGDRPIVRGIVLATDLEEALQPGQVGATPDLRGICVVVFSMVTPDAVVRPDSLSMREQAWTAQVKAWGASRVRVQSILGFDAGDIDAFFRACPASRAP